MVYRDNPLRSISWENFQRMSPAEKAPHFLRNGAPYHALLAQQFDRALLDRVTSVTTQMRLIAKTRGGMKLLQDLL